MGLPLGSVSGDFRTTIDPGIQPWRGPLAGANGRDRRKPDLSRRPVPSGTGPACSTVNVF